MLLLVGLGLEDREISVRALEELKNTELVFLEKYTSFISDAYIDYLRKAVGTKITELRRQDLEEDVKRTVLLAKKKDVAILFPGDPLIATTHKILLDAAKKAGVRTKVLHAASIFTAAIGESGLDFYRFGPVITIPFWFENYKPMSFMESIKKNLANKEHTLLLLDIDQKNRRPMALEEALQILKEADEAAHTSIMKGSTKIIVIGDAGKESQEIALLKVGGINKSKIVKFKGKVLSIIIPAQTSFAEEESLARL